MLVEESEQEKGGLDGGFFERPYKWKENHLKDIKKMSCVFISLIYS